MIKWLLQLLKDIFGSTPKTEPMPSMDEQKSDSISSSLPIYKGIDLYIAGSLSYVEEGLKLVGNSEIPGQKDNPVYTQIYIDVSGQAMHDEVANCMYFVQAILKRGGYKWINTGWAADAQDKTQGWLIKKDLKDITVGDVATKLSMVANSKRHVFVVVGVDHDKKQVLALEANSGNAIKNTNWYPFDILRSCGTPIKK